jgi:hypothetical protein
MPAARMAEISWKCCILTAPALMCTKIPLSPARGAEREVRTLPLDDERVSCIVEWLSARGTTHIVITHIVMEATGVYWKPVWNILNDGAFELSTLRMFPAARRM